jgi:hypothetical protein
MRKIQDYTASLWNHISRGVIWLKFFFANPFKNKIRILVDGVFYSKSQLWQDVFVASITGFKREGYFVEFGATDGILLSNTHMLEKRLNWDGILSEPGLSWQKELSKNRSCIIDNDLIWSATGEEVIFLETDQREFSTVSKLAEKDLHALKRVTGNQYKVNSVTLYDFLKRNLAPNYIDFISVDTEGSEYLIFENFNFEEYKFGIIACEHNYGVHKEKLEELFCKNGYVKVLDKMSLWDGWFVSNELAKNSEILIKRNFVNRSGFLQ